MRNACVLSIWLCSLTFEALIKRSFENACWNEDVATCETRCTAKAGFLA
jgi:hypothetical protein